MPYSIRKAGERDYELVKKDTGEVVSHHKSKAKAEAAIRAIYAHEKPRHPWFGRKD